ncbi:MAG: hypothetical protein QOG99_3207 [Frankiales bacterium]|jgi:hypothetical protein|nr:hypothetical protein [Frankiales bacterium]
MRIVRPAVTAAVTASLVLAGAAGAAAPKKVCNLIKDAAGDDGSNPVFGHDGNLDILSGDLSSDGKTVTIAIRTAAVGTSDSKAPTGRSYYLDFDVPGEKNTLWLGVTTTPTFTSFTPGYVNGSLHSGIAGNATGTFDAAKKEIRISAPASDWDAYATITKKSTFSALTARSYYFVGAYSPTGTGGGSLQAGDQGDATKTYLAGTPSCLKVGS